MSRVLMIASEAAPFAKTGGLADVVGALPIALQELGHEVAVILPRYRGIPWHETESAYDNMVVFIPVRPIKQARGSLKGIDTRIERDEEDRV